MTGRVVKAWSNWYTVATESARLLCQPRGRLKRGSGLLVGDLVTVSPLEDGEGAIEEVHPRQNQLDRPPVANVDLVAVVACWETPPWNPDLVDRILVQAARAGCAALLVVNKIDLVDGDAALREAVEPYRAAGYAVHFTSAVTGRGVDGLAAEAADRVLVLAGPSGAGKSRLLAALAPGHAIASGALSERLGHGRHTTRHAELLPVGRGWAVDTPGFSRLDPQGIPAADLGGCYPEMAALSAGCRFRTCLHRAEPGCAVRGAVDPGRYARYLRLLEECERRRVQVAPRSPRPRGTPEDLDELEGELQDLDDLDAEPVGLDVSDARGAARDGAAPHAAEDADEGEWQP